MSTDVKIATDKEDKPLTRADVEHRVLEVGGPEKLDLSALNLKGIDLSIFNLMGANLSKANLLGANLSGASLNEANLRKAILRGANLRRANLSEASLREANLQEADLSEADLHNSDLYKANLSEAILLRANLSLSHMRDADLSNADLSEANLRGTYLLGAYLRGADLHWANLHGAYIFDTRLNWGNLSEHEKEQLRSRGALGLDLVNTETAENASTIRLRITEDPLTTRNLAIIISALTELHTKLWLIQEGRLADLVEYTDTGNTRFEEEAPLIITKLSHNSPTWIEIVTYILSISGGVTVLRKIIDDVVQTRLIQICSQSYNYLPTRGDASIPTTRPHLPRPYAVL